MLVLQSQLAPPGLEDGRPSADLLHMLRDSVSSRAPQAPGVMQLLDQVFCYSTYVGPPICFMLFWS